MRADLACLLLLTLLVASLPAAQAHGFAPTPTEQYQELLQDRSDDCGPEVVVTGAPSANDCHGSDALVGLVVKEWWDGSQDQLLFRFYLDVGKNYPIVDTLTLGTPAGTKTLAVKTTDDRTFSVQSGFDSVGPVQGIPNENTRFLLDATVSMAHLGVRPGDKITNFNVVSTAAGTRGDYMPGGCDNTVGACQAPDTDEYIAGGGSGSYTLRGPTYYAQLTGPTTPQVATVGQDLGSPIQLSLKNSFHRVNQKITLAVQGADGVTAGFHVGGTGMGAEYKAPLEVSLPGDGATVLHLNLHGERAGAKGTLTIVATTDQGGRSTLPVPYEVKQAASGTGDGSGGPSDGPTPTKGSAAPVMPVVAILLLALALRRRD